MKTGSYLAKDKVMAVIDKGLVNLRPVAAFMMVRTGIQTYRRVNPVSIAGRDGINCGIGSSLLRN